MKIKAIGFLIVCLGYGFACSSPKVLEPRRTTRDFESLIVVMIDTLRSDHLPSYGYPRPTAPFLAELAAEGIQLQGYSASSWTRSSVATLLTGLYPQRHQAIRRNDRLPKKVPYLPQILADQGFRNVAIIANGNVSSQFGFARGFEVFEEHMGFGKPEASQLVEDILQRSALLDDPFYLYVHLIDPHDPYVPAMAWGQEGEALEPVQPHDIRQGEKPMNAGTLAQMIDQYDAEILEMDSALRVLLGGLKEAGVLDRALLVVTSDHGEEFGEHGGVAHGRSLHEEVIKVPWILWGEGLRSYQAPEAFHQVDFLPTALEALGVPIPEDLDGRSWWEEIRDQRFSGRPEQLFHLALDSYQNLALYSPPFKLIRSATEPKQLAYDLTSSPEERETIQLEEDDSQRLNKRLSRLDRDLKKRRYAREVGEATDQVRQQLAALGYLDGGSQPESARDHPAADLKQLTETLAPEEVTESTLDLRDPSAQLLEGWLFSDNNGTWSAPRARFALPVDEASRRIVMVGHSVAARPWVLLTVEIAGEEVHRAELPPGPFDVSFVLPKRWRSASSVMIDVTIRPPLRMPNVEPWVGLHWSRIAITAD